jgi:hypothetical protein
MAFVEERSGRDRRSQPREGAADRRSALPFIGPEQLALDGIRFLRDDIKAFVAEYRLEAAEYFERAMREWYGPLEQRARLLDACAKDSALNEAWKIVHAAGYKAATLLPLVVRHYYGKQSVDRRA